MLDLVPPIHRATHRIGLYLAAADRHGLTQGEAHILALLAPRGTAPLAELQKGLAHKPSTLTSILNRLVARGLVTRTAGRDDRRTFVIATTVKGRAAAREVAKQIGALERAVRARVTPADVAGFQAVVAAVEQEAAARAGVRIFRGRAHAAP